VPDELLVLVQDHAHGHAWNPFVNLVGIDPAIEQCRRTHMLFTGDNFGKMLVNGLTGCVWGVTLNQQVVLEEGEHRLWRHKTRLSDLEVTGCARGTAFPR
jgi:hypothetical protein